MTAEQRMFGFEHQSSSSSSSYDSPIMMVKKVWAAFCHMTHSRSSPRQDAIVEYDEPTFQILLSLEQNRCKKSGRGCHLLLCTVSTQDGTPLTMSDTVAALMLSHVREVLRKTDYVGWFLQNRTLGILLTCLEPGAAVISSRRAMDRIRLVLTERLSLHDPSLVLQLYDDLQLPLFEQHRATEATTQTYARQD